MHCNSAHESQVSALLRVQSSDFSGDDVHATRGPTMMALLFWNPPPIPSPGCLL